MLKVKKREPPPKITSEQIMQRPRHGKPIITGTEHEHARRRLQQVAARIAMLEKARERMTTDSEKKVAGKTLAVLVRKRELLERFLRGNE